MALPTDGLKRSPISDVQLDAKMRYQVLLITGIPSDREWVHMPLMFQEFGAIYETFPSRLF
jgi:hypothetical protein